jgi:hypothetical protein
MTLSQIRNILQQAGDLGTVGWIYFEGGEPFLYYAVLVKSVQEAAGMGFNVGIVSNGYWANGDDDALECLKPFAGLIRDLSISSDRYHDNEEGKQCPQRAVAAAEKLGIPVDTISVAQPNASDAESVVGQLPAGESAVMYRGRAAEKLATHAALRPWEEFDKCPCEDLDQPARVHVDPFGNLHICQGISLGNLFRTPLREICEAYDGRLNPVTGPLLSGGPAGLIRHYGLPVQDAYADACHLCFEARRALRSRFPNILGPDQMYGVPEGAPQTEG